MKRKIFAIVFIVLCLVSFTACKKDNNEGNGGNNNNGGGDNTNTNTNTNTNKEVKEDDLYSGTNKIVYESGSSKLVYYYSGEKITGYEVYIDYGDEVTSKYALDVLDKTDNTIKNAYTSGKYLVVVYNESEYKDLKLSELKEMNSFLKEAVK